MKPSILFRIICAVLGFLLLLMVIFLIAIVGVEDKEIGIDGAFFLGFVGIYFLYYAFWQGRNRIPETLKKAESGDLESQLQLANYYRWEMKGDPNFEEALKWYMQAAEQGDASALNNLGCMYLVGDGVEEDTEKAFKLFHKSAEIGNDSSQYNVGMMIHEGVGTITNKEEAVKWIRLASEQGHAGAQKMLNNILKEESQSLNEEVKRRKLKKIIPIILLLLTLFIFKKCTKFSGLEKGDQIICKVKGSRVFGATDDDKRWFIELRDGDSAIGWVGQIRIVDESGDSINFKKNKIEWIKKHPNQLPMPTPK